MYAAADDECNHHLFEHNQPGLSNVMSIWSLVCCFKFFLCQSTDMPLLVLYVA
jgi:hypothetical protein